MRILQSNTDVYSLLYLCTNIDVYSLLYLCTNNAVFCFYTFGEGELFNGKFELIVKERIGAKYLWKLL
jgi:hypothetical protein